MENHSPFIIYILYKIIEIKTRKKGLTMSALIIDLTIFPKFVG